MEPFITLLTLVLLVTTVAVITGVAIYNHKRRQPTRPKVLGETQPTVIAKKHVAPQEPQPPVVEEAELTVAEETPLTPVAETQPTGIHEAHLPAMAETQPPAVEKAQPTIAQEAQPTAGQETRLLAAEEMQPTAPELTQPAPESKQLEPGKRGGRPRIPSQGYRKQPAPETKSRVLKPEIVCWKRERQWVVAVEVPEELFEKPSVTVIQNGSPLPQDESEEACWLLQQAFGEVIVRWNEDKAVQEARVKLGHNGYLLFKLSGRNLDQGRLVKFPSSGSYLVVVPESWERYETLSGPVPVVPEPVLFAGHQAHFFDLEKSGGQKIAFRLPDGEVKIIEPKAPCFELVGRRLEDASEYVGPLFGGSPPQIKAPDAQAWGNVKTIVVGEEGGGRKRWRMSFSPDPDQTEQDLPSDVADRKGGWYFLRFYNNDDDLIESLDFRFLSVLREIRLRQPLHLPAGNGYEPACVEFLHEADCAVQPASDLKNIQVELQVDKTILSVPPDPACDESRWLVGPKSGPQVEVTINVERIWWAAGGENNPPSEWQDRPVVLSREDFKATSSKALWLQLSKRRWVDKVLVGFERSKARPYNVRVTEKTVAVPLREFGDYVEVGDQTQEYSLRLWIKRDHQDMEGVLAILPASRVTLAPTWVGWGRKKTAIAKAVIRNGTGEIKVNGRRVDDYFRQTPRKAKQFLERLLDLKEVREVLTQKEIDTTVEGSNPTTMQQAKAVAHAIARTLMSYDHNLMAVLKQAGFGGIEVKDAEANRRDKR